MPDRDYSGRDVLDKLGVRAGQRIALDERAWPIDDDLRRRIQDRADLSLRDRGIDLALVTVGAGTDAVNLLREWRGRIQPAGGIWLLSPKRGHPGYLDQNLLIDAGKEAGVVDNKVCSVSNTVSGMRFVIRREDRIC